MLYDGEYYYQYDAEGNRIARYTNTADPALDSNATSITAYTWDNDNQMTGVYNFATGDEYHSWLQYRNLSAGGTQVAAMSYDAFGRMVSQSPSPTGEGRVGAAARRRTTFGTARTWRWCSTRRAR